MSEKGLNFDHLPDQKPSSGLTKNDIKELAKIMRRPSVLSYLFVMTLIALAAWEGYYHFSHAEWANKLVLGDKTKEKELWKPGESPSTLLLYILDNKDSGSGLQPVAIDDLREKTSQVLDTLTTGKPVELPQEASDEGDGFEGSPELASYLLQNLHAFHPITHPRLRSVDPYSRTGAPWCMRAVRENIYEIAGVKTYKEASALKHMRNVDLSSHKEYLGSLSYVPDNNSTVDVLFQGNTRSDYHKLIDLKRVHQFAPSARVAIAYMDALGDQYVDEGHAVLLVYDGLFGWYVLDPWRSLSYERRNGATQRTQTSLAIEAGYYFNYYKSRIHRIDFFSTNKTVTAFVGNDAILNEAMEIYTELRNAPYNRENVEKMARFRELLYGVPSSVTMVQLEHEGGDFDDPSELVRNANNVAGMKVGSSRSGDIYEAYDDCEDIEGKRVKCKFRKYDHWLISLMDKIHSFDSRLRYAIGDQEGHNYSQNPRDWFRGFYKGGYATNPRYESALRNGYESEILKRD